MARLESIAAAGFFPTPPRVADILARWVVPDEQPGRRATRLLDPCAGTGEAAAVVGSAIAATTYGIELQADRAEACRENLNHVLGSLSTLNGVRLAHGAFSVLYLNPPYDYDDEAKRLEHAFLKRCTETLAPKGVLMFLIPQHRLGVSAHYLAAHYEERRVYRFPDPEFAAFKQIVVLARRRMRALAEEQAEGLLQRYSDTNYELPVLPDFPRVPYVAPSMAVEPEPLFAPQWFDAQLATIEAAQRGVFTRADFAEQLWPPDQVGVRPLMPFTRGHRALLLAAGLVNNKVLRRGSERKLIKGRVNKVLVADEDQSDESKDVQREQLRTSLLMLDLDSGEFERIETGAEASA